MRFVAATSGRHDNDGWVSMPLQLASFGRSRSLLFVFGADVPMLPGSPAFANFFNGLAQLYLSQPPASVTTGRSVAHRHWKVRLNVSVV